MNTQLNTRALAPVNILGAGPTLGGWISYVAEGALARAGAGAAA